MTNESELSDLEFVTVSGSGNDFVCIDNRDGELDWLLADQRRCGHFVRALCRRGMSIGADGMIFACRSGEGQDTDIAARHFDPDGSEVELCGNGTACFAAWAMDSGWVDNGEVKIHTPAGVVVGKRVEGNYIRVCIPLPRDITRDVKLQVNNMTVSLDHVITGVPHAVCFVDDVEAVNVQELGSAIRNHNYFAPRGVNVNFVQVLDEGSIAVRTFEFGVEGETLACGTGSASAAILSAIRFNWNKSIRSCDTPVFVRARSGDVLRVFFSLKDDLTVDELCLDTIVRFICRGKVHGDQLRVALPKRCTCCRKV